MSTLPEIEAAIARLPPPEFRELLQKLNELDAEAWDRQIDDAQNGNLERLYLRLREEDGDQPKVAVDEEAKVKPMTFVTTWGQDEDGIWIVECPSIPGCVSQGETREEALANIREAIAACLEVRAERGLPLTVETRQVEVPV